MNQVVSIPIHDTENILPVRGVKWVLRWAATLAVLALVAVVLVDFGYRVLAEQTLVRAAHAGMREAALPRANRRSVERAIRGQLSASLSRGIKIALRSNGGQVGPLAVTLSAPADAALPNWLQLVTVWNSRAKITAWVGQ